jgi:hypothetical protein
MKIDDFFKKYDNNNLSEQDKQQVYFLDFTENDMKDIEVFSQMRYMFKFVKIRNRYFNLINKKEIGGIYDEKEGYQIKEVVDKKEIEERIKIKILG